MYLFDVFRLIREENKTPAGGGVSAAVVSAPVTFLARKGQHGAV